MSCSSSGREREQNQKTKLPKKPLKVNEVAFFAGHGYISIPARRADGMQRSSLVILKFREALS
jgi:hypothetical protein